MAGVGHIDDRKHDYQEIQFVPGVGYIGIVVYHESQRYHLNRELDHENRVEYVIKAVQTLGINRKVHKRLFRKRRKTQSKCQRPVSMRIALLYTELRCRNTCVC